VADVEADDTAEAVALLDDAGGMTEHDLAELREFMTCERLPRRADPRFRERLRVELWWGLVVRRLGGADRVPRA
jgi:hypothetical protein